MIKGMDGNTAQDPKVTNIWSTQDPGQVQPPVQPNPPDNDIQEPMATEPSSGGSFGKPGLGGESVVVETGVSMEAAPLPEAERPAEVEVSPEVLVSPEIGEKTEPAKVEESPKPKEVETAIAEDLPTKGKIVDKRTGKVRTHRVDVERADKITKIADIDEQEFIDGVQRVHSIV